MADDLEFESNDIIKTIYAWSLDRPIWQRDALRRVLQKSEITENDIEDLLSLNKKENELPVKDIIATPLSSEHFFSNSDSQNSLILKNISDVKGVNILAPDQKLDFATEGITVVYGDNGSGKSGYTRILKNAGRARHRDKIYSNIFTQSSDNSSAKISYFFKGEDDNLEEVSWIDSPNPHPILSAISIFDSECAKELIKKRNEMAFRPYGLDIPDKFASICKEVEDRLKQELRDLENGQNQIFQSYQQLWNPETEVGKFISGLSSKTDKEYSRSLSKVSLEEEKRLEQIKQALSKDIKISINDENLKLQKINNFISAIDEYKDILSDDNLKNTLKIAEDLNSCKNASKSLAKNISDSSFSDIGNDAWKQLWNSARVFSEKYAYKNKSFPVVDGDDKICVLCQQAIESETSERLKNFDNFIKSDIEERIQNLQNKLQSNLSKLSNLLFLHDQRFIRLIEDYKSHDTYLCRKLTSFVAYFRLKKNIFLRAIKNDNFSFPKIRDFPDGFDILKLKKDSVTKYISELLQAERNNDTTPLKKEKDEISDKITLQKLILPIDAEIDRLGKIAKIKKCIKNSSTRAVTQLGNTIADEIVTPKLRDAFLKEIIDLVGNRFRVEFEQAGGKYGSPQYKINLIANPKLDVSLILSEGEQTCVAIAAFLAELSTASHFSSLVFDDPINSLDHKWRYKVAKRLVEEAKKRQVIIFTHDLVFFNDINDYCKKEGVNFSAKQVQRYPEISGYVNENQPWDGMKVRQRIDALEKEARKLKENRNSYSEEEYKIKARSFYSKLRASWERGLEEVGLCNVIIRHRDYINTKNLSKIRFIDLDDCNVWSSNFQKCCDFTDGHDSPRARNQSLPEPDELLQDSQSLLVWVNEISEKQKG